MDFENYKRDVLDFEHFNSIANQTFEERLGKPTELEASLGLISIAFNDLERKISEGICKLLGVNGPIGKIVTCELSFSQKLNLFSSLVTELRKSHYFNLLEGVGFRENYQRELVKALNKCEELRNRVTHSVFLKNNENGDFKNKRLKITARAKHGLIEKIENFEIYNLLNIYDFIVSMQMEIDDFFIGFKKRD